MLTLLLLAAYAATLAFALHLLAEARRREDALLAAWPTQAERAGREEGTAPTRAVTGHPALERLAADVHETLDVDRVAVVVSDDDEPGVGRVEACFGPPRLLGSRVELLPVPVTGPMSPFGATALGIAGADEHANAWTFAHVPITGSGELLGAVTVAALGEREFTDDDLTVLERLARSGVPRFDRRRHALIPRALA
jgi:hypothetical protein